MADSPGIRSWNSVLDSEHHLSLRCATNIGLQCRSSSGWISARQSASVSGGEEVEAASLLDMMRVVVPREIANQVHDYLRLVGRNGHEGIGFWAGVLRERIGTVGAALVPRQLSGQVGRGLAVVVSGEDLFLMNVWLHEHGMRLIAQVHSHPTDAYHSETDEAYPVLAEAGGLSIVVPDFARAPFSLDASAVYRLGADGRWNELSRIEVGALIQMEE